MHMATAVAAPPTLALHAINTMSSGTRNSFPRSRLSASCTNSCMPMKPNRGRADAEPRLPTPAIAPIDTKKSVMEIDAALIDPENSAADGRPTTLDASGATTHATTLTSASEMDGNPKARTARTPATREHTNAAAIPADSVVAVVAIVFPVIGPSVAAVDVSALPFAFVDIHMSTAMYIPIIRLSAAIAAGTLDGRLVPRAAMTAAKLTDPPM